MANDRVGHLLCAPQLYVSWGRTLKRRHGLFNSKRRFAKPEQLSRAELDALAESVHYGGNPAHKKNPGDFGLTPPSDARLGKSLCDKVKIFKVRDALRLLRKGVGRGLVSDRFDGLWPKNVWAVTEAGVPLEAQLENAERGTYHGYPMPEGDPLADQVLRRWEDTGV